jgi:3-oxoacyl-[acyl-carrier-protein] synthase II
MPSTSRVFVTGLGVVSSVGCGAEEFWAGCRAGTAVAVDIPTHWNEYYRATSRVWAPLPEPDYARAGLGKTDLLTLGKPAALAIVAAQQALELAQVEVDRRQGRYPLAQLQEIAAPRAGIFLGTGLGAAQAPFNNYYAHLLAGLKSFLETAAANEPSLSLLSELRNGLREHPRVNPLVICQTMPNAIAASLAIRFGIQGPSETVCAACASGTIAIGKAFHAIRHGALDLALTGGAEHLGDRAGGVFMGFDRLQTLAKPLREIGSENRPFDRERSGFLFSEGGAGIAVLESEQSVRRRGVKPIAEVLGFAQTTDAYSIAAIRDGANQIETMIDLALTDAGVPAHLIDYVNAHGTSTEVNDALEAQIIGRKFRPTAKVNSTKSILGHSIGAAGAIEFVATALSLRDQQLHLSKNLDEPIADLDFCRESGPASLDYAFTHSFGFGGHNAGLVLRRATD